VVGLSGSGDSYLKKFFGFFCLLLVEWVEKVLFGSWEAVKGMVESVVENRWGKENWERFLGKRRGRWWKYGGKVVG